ncbi:unnamed protein product [Spirodela intermedia]|uniref:Uncharacterized protein n=2 Tax=Spirodela intermedia TaxID=51605 RepID=A0A7I8IUF7_SPIIN|nr:unnamed protein product [Spirodela intermedia]CAA6660793.1 unnamed protein product [Spirodela intermedia]CAA7397146.1 unnamed protein product [Spirodela intermedia]
MLNDTNFKAWKENVMIVLNCIDLDIILRENLLTIFHEDKKDMDKEYIVEMSHLASKLKVVKLKLLEDLLVDLVLISLPSQFNQFKVSYNCQRDK